ncbi:hypothetical protein [Actinomadura rubteroloni]|nr:hypothetical protein [Actinomadura rubteroloni]
MEWKITDEKSVGGRGGAGLCFMIVTDSSELIRGNDFHQRTPWA